MIRRFGRYALIRKIGEGGMATVFLAQRDHSDTPCVVKLVRPELSGRAAVRMIREAQAGASLSHPNIVRTLDAGEIDGTWYLAVELIVGSSVAKMMFEAARSGRPISPGFVVAVACSVLDALAYAHETVGADGQPLRIIHRDLAPTNLMVDVEGTIKVIDFGLVRMADGAETRPGTVMGTLRYVSPEQGVGSPVDTRADLYTLSVTLFELATGRALVPDGTPHEILRAVLTLPAPSVSAFPTTFPPQVAAIIVRNLAKDPKARFADASATVDAIRAVAGNLAATPAAIAKTLVELCPEVVSLAEEVQHLNAPERAMIDELTRAGAFVDVPPSTPTRVLTPIAPFAKPRAPARTWGVLAVLVVVAVSVLAAALVSSSAKTPPSQAVAEKSPLVAPSAPEPSVEPKPPTSVSSAPPPTAAPAPAPAPKKSSRRKPPRTVPREASGPPPEQPPAPPPAVTPKLLRDRLATLHRRASRLRRSGDDPGEAEALLVRITMLQTSPQIVAEHAKIEDVAQEVTALETKRNGASAR